MTGRKTDTGPGDDFARARDAFLIKLAAADTSEAAARVGIVLAVSFANRGQFAQDGTLEAWPSMRLLSKRSGLFRSRVTRALERLEQAGLITIAKPEKRGVGHFWRYTLHHEIGRSRADRPY